MDRCSQRELAESINECFEVFRPQDLTETSGQLRPGFSSLWTIGPTDCQWIRNQSTAGFGRSIKVTFAPRSILFRSLAVPQPLTGTENRYRKPRPVLDGNIGTGTATGTGN